MPNITFEEPWDLLFTNTLMPEAQSLFLVNTDEPSFIRTITDPEAVFATPPGELLNHLMPMVEIELSGLNPALHGKLYFLYEEAERYELMYQLDEHYRITQLQFFDFDHSPMPLSGTQSFDSGSDNIRRRISGSEHRFFKLLPHKPLPEDFEMETHGEYDDWLWEDWSEWIDRAQEAMGGRRPEVFNYFGPYFAPVQNTIYPLLEGHPQPHFYYAGRFDGSNFGLCDFTYFLFYHPATRTVVQIQQCT